MNNTNQRVSLSSDQYTQLLRTLAALGGGSGLPPADVSALATEATLGDVEAIIQSFVDVGYVKSAGHFILDGVRTPVIEDTVTPSNNAPLPVKITSTSGDINITAGDLNVQLSHTGATPDSTQIGDGTNILAINPDGSINTSAVISSTGGQISNLAISSVTAEQIDATSHPSTEVIVTARETNTGWIRVGVGTVTASTGQVLYPAETFSYNIANSNLLWVLAEVDGEDVSATYLI